MFGCIRLDCLHPSRPMIHASSALLNFQVIHKHYKQRYERLTGVNTISLISIKVKRYCKALLLLILPVPLMLFSKVQQGGGGGNVVSRAPLHTLKKNRTGTPLWLIQPILATALIFRYVLS